MRYNKKGLWKLIIKNAHSKIHRLHTISIINILIEEIVDELKSGNEIDIENFGTLKIKKIKPKKITTVNEKKIKFVKGIYLLRFVLPPHISKYLSKKSLEKLKGSGECKKSQE
jgi:nucleoid DNA-binding protein